MSYNGELLAGVVDQLSQFDRDMNAVVVESGILAGIPSGALTRAGETVCGPAYKGVSHAWAIAVISDCLCRCNDSTAGCVFALADSSS